MLLATVIFWSLVSTQSLDTVFIPNAAVLSSNMVNGVTVWSVNTTNSIVPTGTNIQIVANQTLWNGQSMIETDLCNIICAGALYPTNLIFQSLWQQGYYMSTNVEPYWNNNTVGASWSWKYNYSWLTNVNLTCIGYGDVEQYSRTLVTPNVVFTCSHAGGGCNSVFFRDYNQNSYQIPILSRIPNIGGSDLCIEILVTNVPAIIPPCFLLSPSSRLSLNSSPAAVLARKNSGQLIAGNATFDTANSLTTFTWNLNSFFGNTDGLTGGDSGSPTFVVYNNLPILVSTADVPLSNSVSIAMTGPLLFSQKVWNGIVSTVGSNNLNLIKY
jgi:hypothetical protein